MAGDTTSVNQASRRRRIGGERQRDTSIAHEDRRAGMARRDLNVVGGKGFNAAEGARGMVTRFGCMGMAIAGLVAVLIGYVLLSVSTVPPGYVGVVVQLGQVQPYTLP